MKLFIFIVNLNHASVVENYLVGLEKEIKKEKRNIIISNFGKWDD